MLAKPCTQLPPENRTLHTQSALWADRRRRRDRRSCAVHSSMSTPLSPSEKRLKMLSDYEGYKKQFQQVEDITATDLHHMLEKSNDKLVLVDVRTPEERTVATLRTAVLSPEEFAEQKEQLKDKTVITYCTAGLRSGKLAAKIQQEGFQVKNLKGSIIAWTQEGYPLVDSSGQPTKRVHTYGAHWAEQIGDGYEAETFSKQKGLLEGARSVLPKWLGGTG